MRIDINKVEEERYEIVLFIVGGVFEDNMIYRTLDAAVEKAKKYKTQLEISVFGSKCPIMFDGKEVE